MFAPALLNGVPGILDPFPTHGIASEDGSDPSAGADSTVHVAQPETSHPKAENGQGSDLPKVLLDPLNNMGIPSTSHANALDPENNSLEITNIVGDEATFLPEAIVIGSSTLKKGDSPVTVAGVVVSLAPTAMIIGSETLPLPHTQEAVTTIAGSPLIYHPHAVAIAGKTIKPGSSPKTFSEAVVAIDPLGIIVDPKPLALPQTKRIVTAVAGHEMTLLPQAIALDGTTLKPDGSPFTLAGIAMTFEPSSLLIGSQVIPFSHLNGVATSTPQEHLIISNHEATGIGRHQPSKSIISDGNNVFGDSSLRSGATGMTIDGISLSLLSGGEVILNGTILTPGGAEMTIDGTHISVASDGNLVIGGTTLRPGAPILSTDDVPAMTTAPETNATAKSLTTASNASLGALSMGTFGGRPMVASPSTGTSSTTAVTTKGKAVRSVTKVSSLTIAMLSILIGLWIS